MCREENDIMAIIYILYTITLLIIHIFKFKT